MPEPLSDLEVLALAAVARLGSDAYGVSIRHDILKRTGRRVSIGSLYKALQRLEDRKLVVSSVGEPTSIRGGRAKKHVEINDRGLTALESSVRSFHRMIEGLGLDPRIP